MTLRDGQKLQRGWNSCEMICTCKSLHNEVIITKLHNKAMECSAINTVHTITYTKLSLLQ